MSSTAWSHDDLSDVSLIAISNNSVVVASISPASIIRSFPAHCSPRFPLAGPLSLYAAYCTIGVVVRWRVHLDQVLPSSPIHAMALLELRTQLSLRNAHRLRPVTVGQHQPRPTD